MLKLFEYTGGPTPQQKMQVAYQNWRGCTRCGRCAYRKHLMYGAGNPAAALMIVQSLPSYYEDKEGFPFASRDVNQLMVNLLASADLSAKEDIYITHAVKCPGEDQVDEKGERRRAEPTPAEIAICKEMLDRQIAIVNPAVVLLQGKFAHKIVTGDARPLTKVVGHARLLNPKCIAISTHNPAGVLSGERAILIHEYLRDWYSALSKLDTVGRLWRPDAPTFGRGWVLPEGIPK